MASVRLGSVRDARPAVIGGVFRLARSFALRGREILHSSSEGTREGGRSSGSFASLERSRGRRAVLGARPVPAVALVSSDEVVFFVCRIPPKKQKTKDGRRTKETPARAAPAHSCRPAVRRKRSNNNGIAVHHPMRQMPRHHHRHRHRYRRR